jgi:hypothetical protein
MKTIAATLIAFSLLAGAAQADTSRDIFTDLDRTAPRSVFDGIQETAPRSVFDQIRDVSPRSASDAGSDAQIFTGE